jgi:hypothetical protein
MQHHLRSLPDRIGFGFLKCPSEKSVSPRHLANKISEGRIAQREDSKRPAGQFRCPKPIGDVSDQCNLHKSENANGKHRSLRRQTPMKETGDGHVALAYNEWKKEEEQRPTSFDYPHQYARYEAEYPYQWN